MPNPAPLSKSCYAIELIEFIMKGGLTAFRLTMVKFTNSKQLSRRFRRKLIWRPRLLTSNRPQPQI